ncbi:MAG: extracellular solute-binding protein [Acidimicrobiia bacterium]|nr:extracellular solute-binding protein [Acidimicrobiia bacterium]
MTHVPHLLRLRAVGLSLAVLLVATACGSDDPPPDGASSDGSLDGVTITVYSGRDEELIQPVFDLFEAETGATVEARYAGSADQALLIDTEGDNSPADVFISQSPGAMGFLDQQGRLSLLSADTLDRVDESFRSESGSWVGITGRVRVLVYNTDAVDESELPRSILELTDPAYAGRVAVAPANGSFQDFVTAMRAELGDEATADWLDGMAANDAPNYPKNSAIVDAVARGEIDMGLVNHYYLVESLEEDPDLPAANHVFADGDLGSLLITTAAGVIDSSDSPDAAEALVAFLLSDAAQELSANGEKEYPLVDSVPAPDGLEPLADLAAIVVDLDVLAGGLTGTQELIDQSGIQQ